MKQLIFAAVILLVINLSGNSVFSQINRTYTVTNNTGITITSVYISPLSLNTWSSNLYTKAKLAMSETFDFIYPYDATNCHYDLRYYDASGREYVLRNVDLCTGDSVSLTLPPDIKSNEKMDKK